MADSFASRAAGAPAGRADRPAAGRPLSECAPSTFDTKRNALEEYFDRTASDAWAKLTSDAPVSGIRATVRAGRDAMRATLLSWLPEDLTGARVLDAGCGAGQMSAELARRGAHVVAIDIAGTLVDLARERYDHEGFGDRIDWRTGDMTDPALGAFDHVVAMDSLIHYRDADIIAVLDKLLTRTSASAVFTFAPRTPALSAMHAVGKLFPKGDKSPAIEPVGEAKLKRLIGANLAPDWAAARSERIKSGFYISQGLEVVRP